MSELLEIDWVLVVIVAVIVLWLLFCIGFLNLVFDIREDNRIDRQLRRENKKK